MTHVIFIQGAGDGAHREDALLADSLRRHLGDDFTVDFPRMPAEDDPDYDLWRPVIEQAVVRASDPVVLVGHSAGGCMLLKYIAEETPKAAAICLIAAPFPGGDPDWTFDGFDLPDDLAARMPSSTPVFLYASEDDEIVPFAHRDLYAAAIPGATTRTTVGGHQLGRDLSAVAEDIRRVRRRPNV
ncbi:alpha/beta fold hydrolase [soil metagenome]